MEILVKCVGELSGTIQAMTEKTGQIDSSERYDPSIYQPVIDRSRELLTAVELNYPDTHRITLFDTTPGVWGYYEVFVLSEGVSTVSTIVLANDQNPNTRVTITQITRTEESIVPVRIDSGILTITKRPFPPLNPRLFEMRVLAFQEDFIVAAIVYGMESESPAGKEQEVLNYFFQKGPKNSEEDIREISELLEDIVRLRPVINAGEVSYVGSFDALSGGNKSKVLTGIQKEGFSPTDFVAATLAMLDGDPVPVTRYDLGPDYDLSFSISVPHT